MNDLLTEPVANARLIKVEVVAFDAPFREFNLIDKNEFFVFAESRGVLIDSVNFDDLKSKQVIFPVKNRYSKYFVYLIWCYRIYSANKLMPILEQDKEYYLRSVWTSHLQMIHVCFLINDYVTEIQNYLTPD